MASSHFHAVIVLNIEKMENEAKCLIGLTPGFNLIKLLGNFISQVYRVRGLKIS
jgi:hypothetical protein